MAPRNVLYVHTTSEVGGSDVSLAHIVERLDRRRYVPIVALPSDGPLVPRLEASGATVAIVPSMRKLTSRKGALGLAAFAAGYPMGVAALARVARTHRVDLIHTNTIHNLYGWAAARLTRTPHIWHVREIVWQSAALRRLERHLALRHSARVVVTSNAVGAMFDHDGVRPSSVVQIANGVDTTRFSPGASDRVRRDFGIRDNVPLVGAAGRLDVWKGFEDFIEAAARFRATISQDRGAANVRFVIAGGPIEGHEDYEGRLKALAASRGLADALVFAGWRYGPDTMPEFHRSVDVFVLPSREPEPFGLVVLEAMASGKPVIATKQGGPLEIVIDGETGRLVPASDPDAMAAAMQELIADPAMAAAFGAAGRARATEEYSIERTAARLQVLYDDVLKT